MQRQNALQLSNLKITNSKGQSKEIQAGWTGHYKGKYSPFLTKQIAVQ